jgi:sirohydrochlorin ferrochelatase
MPNEPGRKRALILVDHGSRLEEANRVLEEMAEMLEQKLADGVRVIAAHMELARPCIEEAFKQCSTEEIGDVTVFPYFLSPGRHSRKDIPHLCRQAAEKYPDIQYRLLEPFGKEPMLVEIIEDRVKSK